MVRVAVAPGSVVRAGGVVELVATGSAVGGSAEAVEAGPAVRESAGPGAFYPHSRSWGWDRALTASA